MKIKRLTLQTGQNLETLRAFYTTRLGLSLVFSKRECLGLKAGSSLLMFEKNGASEAPCYHLAFNIVPHLLEDALIFLSQKGIELLTFEERPVIDFPNWNARALYFLDPAGNVLELIARNDLKTSAVEKFFLPEQHLLSLSEIGLPVPEIRPFYEHLQAELNIPVYSHISNMQSFCGAGNEEGLFILVPLQRAWFPSSVMNGIYPAEIVIEGRENRTWSYPGLPYVIHTEKTLS